MSVVPLVDRSKRRQAQWESDIVALHELLATVLPRNAYRLQYEATVERSWRRNTGDPKYDKDIAALRLDELRAAREQAEDLVDQQLTQTKFFARRIRQVHRKSPKWLSIRASELALDVYRPASIEYGGTISEDEKWVERWKRFTDACQTLASQIEPLALDMKPPPRHLMQRLKRRIWTRLRPRRRS
ncbi:MAG: hypothetical protein FWG16_08030 [Micrococcales bacterium]|nr:hypothetical protein [Micrococcales bacterium]